MSTPDTLYPDSLSLSPQPSALSPDPSALSPQPSAVIIGGGIAGLSAALALAERGQPPLLLEAKPNLGGRLAGEATVSLEGSGKSWGFRAEHGIHGLWGQYHNLYALLERLGLREGLIAARREDWLHGEAGRVLRAEAGSAVRRSIFPAPLHYLALLLRPRFLAMLTPLDLLGLPRVTGSLFLALAYDPLCEPTPLGERTVAELFVGWPPRLRAFLSALMRSGLAAHPEDVPLSGALAFLRFYTLLRRDAWAFAYLPDDAEAALLTPLVAAIQAAGGTLRTTARVTCLERDGANWVVCWEEDGAQQRIVTPHVVLALDAPAAQALLNASPATAPEAARLSFPPGLETGIVRLWFSRAPQAGAESGICSGDLSIDNFFWLQHFQRGAAAWHAATGGAVVEAHIYGPPEVLALPDAALLARAAADVQRAHPELRGTLIHQTIQRNTPSHTRFGVGADERHLGVASPWPGLYCCGDWVRYPHPALFLERACVTGLAAANAVLAAYQARTWPILPASPPEAPARLLERGLRGVRRWAAARRGRGANM
jgi:carotenoid phi-ring synthase / carotenoid chi-ring synthase